MEHQIIYLCEDTPDGVCTAVYDAWAAGIPRERLSIQTENLYEMQFFTDYIHVRTDYEKSDKVMRSVKRKIGHDACDMVYKAALSCAEDKIDIIYDFLKLGFRFGKSVMDMHGDKAFCRIFEISRNVGNEAHLFREFVRFRDLESGVLVSRINPKNQVLPFLGEHFSDRFMEEDFVILDETHGMGLFHERRKPWYLMPLEQDVLNRIWEQNSSKEYEALWKTFFRTIAIEERKNDLCQRNHCALRYRTYMVEFHS